MRSLSQDDKLAVENALGITSIATSSAEVASSTASTTPVVATSITETEFNSVGPVLGAEAARKAIVSILLVIAAIVLFIAYAFRKVSEPVSSWKYGLTAIIALVHNIIIPIGLFAILGHFKGYEVDTLFVTALLVVLGFSVHDNIVVFDRVRENLHTSGTKKSFDQVVGDSISQTFTRSVNTSLTTLLALVVLYFVGGAATQHFSLALIVGIAAGTYSSIFIGSPLLVTLQKMQVKKAAKLKALGKAGQ
jgi:preprotein translocase subunit SecF